MSAFWLLHGSYQPLLEAAGELAGAGDVEEALSEEDPWGKTSKERPVEPSPEPLPVTQSRPVLDVEKFEEWMDQRTLNGYVEKSDGTGIRYRAYDTGPQCAECG